jgi:Bifunctional DNA primase/polymerase, N-terminal
VITPVDALPHQRTFSAEALPNMLEWACRYGAHGTPVFPCNEHAGPTAKAPYTRNGFKDATTDLDQIIDWWTRWPNAMIGRPVPLDQICLDIDPRNGGDRWALIEMAGVELPTTPMVLSGRYDGGHHLFYQRPPGRLTGGRLPKGVDLRVGGKHYTIVPPSIHPDGWEAAKRCAPCYLWRYGTHPIAELPQQIAALLVPAKTERTAFTTRAKEPTAGRLAGICRKVASTPPGKRQTIGFTWAARILKEAGYGLAAWDAVADAMRDAGASEHDIRTALREAPAGSRVHDARQV